MQLNNYLAVKLNDRIEKIILNEIRTKSQKRFRMTALIQQ